MGGGGDGEERAAEVAGLIVAGVEGYIAALRHLGETGAILGADNRDFRACLNERAGLQLRLIILADNDAASPSQVKVDGKVAHARALAGRPGPA